MTTSARLATVSLPAEARDAIARHGESAYPHECCGILLGRVDGDTRRIERLLPIENRWDEGEQSHRFLIEGTDVLAAEREARRAGLDIVGFYHSHPDDRAVPSEFDREHAWPWYTYLIASIHGGQLAEIRGWQLRDDRSSYEPVTLA